MAKVEEVGGRIHVPARAAARLGLQNLVTAMLRLIADPKEPQEGVTLDLGPEYLDDRGRLRVAGMKKVLGRWGVSAEVAQRAENWLVRGGVVKTDGVTLEIDSAGLKRWQRRHLGEQLVRGLA
jgi:hypothetical protein